MNLISKKVTRPIFILILLAAILLTGCSAHQWNTPLAGKHYQETGIASWYGKRFQRKRTSSGERYNMYAMTAAHKTLPLRSFVQVTNLANGKKVIVRVNDREPFAGNRLIDLSYAAAKKIGMVNHGTAPVAIKLIAR